LGAGPYIYTRKEDAHVELEPNPYYPTEPSIKRVRITDAGINELYDGKIDVTLSPLFIKKPNKVQIETKNEKLSSLLTVHWLIIVNGMTGKIFSNTNLRKAAQYIIYKSFIKNYSMTNSSSFFSPSLQFYPPLFAGSLDNAEVENLIEVGKDYIDKLREVSQSNPITCIYRLLGNYNYCDAFDEYNIKTNKQMKNFSEVKNVVYKTFDADLVNFGVSYASADPDGIYHFLGKNGAIWTPLASRSKVEDLIEEGRQITNSEKLNDHYKNVSR
jgi:ABC-type transport system substrate-binding protein